MMSKRINRFLALLFVLALGIATLLVQGDANVSEQRANVAGSNAKCRDRDDDRGSPEGNQRNQRVGHPEAREKWGAVSFRD